MLELPWACMCVDGSKRRAFRHRFARRVAMRRKKRSVARKTCVLPEVHGGRSDGD
jgi:hypothetical protein